MVVPDSRLPRWARISKFSALLLGYSMALLVGYGDLTAPSPVIEQTVGPATPTAAYASIAFGLAGAVGVLLHRWRWEWLAASVLAFALLARALPVWVGLEESAVRLSPAAGMTMGAALMFLRAIELWHFACKTGRLAARSSRREAHQGES